MRRRGRGEAVTERGDVSLCRTVGCTDGVGLQDHTAVLRRDADTRIDRPQDKPHVCLLLHDGPDV
jgi:hypothetical protein